MQSIRNLIVTKDQTRDAIRELVEIHRARMTPINAPIPGEFIGHACITCDEIWPCKTAILLAAFAQVQAAWQTMESQMRDTAETDEMAQAVWKSWYSEMIRQARFVSGEKSSWQWLSQSDKALDQAIAIAVVEKLLEILAQET